MLFANMDTSNLPYKLATYHEGERPYVDFSIYDKKEEKLKRMQKFVPAECKTDKAKKAWAKKYIKDVNELLVRGYVMGNKTIANEKGINISENSKLMDVINFCVEVKQSTTRKSTSDSYSSARNVFFDFLVYSNLENIKLRDFTKKFPHQFRDYLKIERKNSNTTCNNIFEYIGACFTLLIDREIIKSNPFSGIKSLTEEIGANIAYNAEQKIKLEALLIEDEQLYLFTRFIYFCYLRPKELRFLKVKHLEENRIFIPATISKNKKSEFVTIPKQLEELIQKSGLRQKEPEQYIFTQRKKGFDYQLPRNLITNKHKLLVRKIGLSSDYTLYSWKHTGVVNAYKAGIKIVSIQRQLRHSSLDVTAKYLKSLGLEENTDFLEFE